MRVGDLIQPTFADQVKKIVEVKKRVLTAAGSSAVDLNADAIAAEYAGYAEQLKPMITDTTRILLDAIDADKKILFEGAQGSLLDVDHGTYPFVTSSNSSGVGISTGSGVPGNWLTNVVGVCKCYSTRVGGGPFPTEQDNDQGQHIRDRGNEYGTTTGRPRRCGWFDAVAVRYTARLSGVTSVALTMVDVLAELDSIEVCVAYELNGERIDYFPSSVNDLRNLKPIYESIPGWKSDVTGARVVGDLPEGALNYIRRIEELIGRPIEFVSVGPDKEQTVRM